MNNDQSLAELKKRLGVVWKDEALLLTALTHSSFAHETKTEHNQRLEFLGDAVLELVVSDYLYRHYQHYEEGKLTRARAAVVCEPSLAGVARELGLGLCLWIGKGEENSGGRERPSILADTFEALLGAVYLDQGLEQARSVALSFLVPLIEEVAEGYLERDYKTILQETVQRYSPEPVRYVILAEKGPDHAKTFIAGVIYRGKLVGNGSGCSKKEAEQQAARVALKKLKV
ncbi:MAG: ribonuclease III [Peptococcaceae bacterium]|nr:MAG: ribonuclease III [Peptococcaceae bacterium]